MRSPFEGGLGPGGVRALYVLALIAAVKGLALIGIAEALARGIAGLFVGDTDVTEPVLLGAAAVIARALASWAGQWYATRASLGAKEQLRADLADRMLDDPATDVGSATTLATRGLDDLDPYYRTVLPAAMGAAVIPLLVGVRMLTADWLAALIVVLTVPLIPVFMILIGRYTRDRVDEAAGALDRLADHLVELARGLPVLVGLGRVGEQAEALHAISEDHRRRTLGTLRTAFLSALALELIATISVALVAVTVGIRLVGGDLPLEVGLLVLILAPECYAPLREVGTAFHAAQDGVSALGRTREILDRPVDVPGGHGVTGVVGTVVSVRDLEVTFDGRAHPAVVLPRLEVRAGETVALTGPSGAGKSTVLRVLAGRLASAGGVDGETAIDGRTAWLPQHPRTIGDTVHDELRRWSRAAGVDADADERVDASERRIAELLERLGLAGSAGADPSELSP
ncbi:MAG: ABC transporter transmembrane domain-containing protein, partial [Naasia sp.]